MRKWENESVPFSRQSKNRWSLSTSIISLNHIKKVIYVSIVFFILICFFNSKYLLSGHILSQKQSPVLQETLMILDMIPCIDYFIYMDDIVIYMDDIFIYMDDFLWLLGLTTCVFVISSMNKLAVSSKQRDEKFKILWLENSRL